MAARATRCPHCQTSFRVTEAQLGVAGGRVRCGACLAVFNATEHWLEVPTETVVPTPPDPIPTQQPAHPEDAATPETESEEEIRFDDERGLPEFTDTTIDEEPLESTTSTTESAPTGATADADDPPLQQPEQEAEPELESGLATEPEWHATLEPASTADNANLDEAVEPLRADDDFDRLVLEGRRQFKLTRQQVRWSALCLLAALALLAQALYVNFDTLAQSRHRPLLAKTCEVANFFLPGEHCTLPAPRNLALIESRGLNIYSHPRFANSLLVDALIINNAVFEQPFPDIELLFRDPLGQTVAARRFTPAEYLAGEMRDAALMPSRQTIHITIGILDPGTSAVNYRMQFHPAKVDS